MLLDVLLLIGLPGLLILLAGALPYGIWFIVSVYRKRWRLAMLLVAMPILVMFALGLVARMVEAKRYADYLAGVFGASADLTTPIFVYDSPRDFNGDGYSIEVHPLPASIRAAFSQRDRNVLSHHPKLPDSRKGWVSYTWREGPLEDGFRRHLQFALSRVDSTQASELDAHFVAIRACLSRQNAFYAFFIKDHGDQISNIDFFVVDLEHERIYLINNNT